MWKNGGQHVLMEIDAQHSPAEDGVAGMRFILVDHSINGPGGHYLTYALSILDAARLKGYKTLLVTGMGFHPNAAIAHPYLRAYHYNFFGNRNDPQQAWHSQAQLVASSIKNAWDRFVLWNAFVGPLPEIARLTKKAVRSVLVILFVPQLFHMITGRSLREARVLASTVASRFLQRVATRIVSGLRQPAEHSAAFATDTRSWLTKCAADESDVILFPTISFRDCVGLAKVVRAHPQYEKCRWRLLFRRNLFPGDRSTYDSSTTERYRALLVELKKFSTFLTDSIELSDQYRFAFDSVFHTLPIPHSKKYLARANHQEPLCISYIGDARTEKGFHLLPAIVATCRQDPSLRGRVKFAFQANYNVPGGEPLCVVAKSQLRLVDDEKVILAEQPLGPQEYDRLLAQSDIGLLPYLRSNYYARSSGVLIEYLSAGIPVIVPSNTWLAAQFEKHVHAYQRSLLRDQTVCSQVDVAGAAHLLGANALRLCFNGVGEGFLSIQPAAATDQYFRLELLVTFHSESHRRWVRKVTLSGSPGREGTLAMLRIPNRTTQITVKRLVSGELSYVPDIHICTLRARETGVPLSAIGLTYDEDSDIVDCIRELTDHYSHYKGTALAFSDEVNAFHNASTAVEHLVEPAASGVSAS